MYRQSKGVGFVASPGSSVSTFLTSGTQRQYQGPRKQFLGAAAGALPVGFCVVPAEDGAARQFTQALQASANHQQSIAGVYEGEGGDGAEPSISGLTGKAAVANNLCWFTIHGIAKAVVQALTIANCVPRCPLNIRAATNDLVDVAAPTAPAQSGIYLLETFLTAGTQFARNVWVRLT